MYTIYKIMRRKKQFTDYVWYMFLQRAVSVTSTRSRPASLVQVSK